jgi:hypothetical protein
MGLAGTTAASAAPAARSVTIGCAAYNSGFCGSEQLKFGHYTLDVKGQHATYGNKVILWTKSNTDPAQDFIAKNYNGLSTSGGPDKTFEYAPNGVPSGLCLSFPSETRGSGAVLRNCNQSIWQTFKPVYVDGTYVGWKNQASGYAMEDGAFGNQGTQVDQWTWNGGDNQDWRFNS